ncbi:MAG: hypothetical protein GDA49_03855 [Rhodospirillales bacterium]|nr:hypothetical protein [Rhodospirillales bacterium]
MADAQLDDVHRQVYGIAFEPRGLVQEDIRRGRLAAPFSLTLELDCRVYFVCLPHALERPPVAAFRDWARAQAVATMLPPEDIVLSQGPGNRAR